MTADAILTAAASLLAERPDRAAPGTGWPCCVWTDIVCERAYGVSIEDRRARIYVGEGPWSSVQAYVDAGLADVVHLGLDGRASPPPPWTWSVHQGWRKLDENSEVPADGPEINGHTWLWYAVSETHGIALESSEASGVRYAGRRVDGMTADELDNLPVDPQPWAERIAPYAAGVAVAVLRPVGTAAVPSAPGPRWPVEDEPDPGPPLEDVALRMPRGPVTRMPGRIVTRPTPEPAMPTPLVAHRELLEDEAEAAQEAAVRALADGRLTADEAADEIAAILARVIDALVPTGPLDPYDDEAIKASVVRAVDWMRETVADWGKRDPAKLRRRAVDALARGNSKRHARLMAAAERVEARQAG